MKVKELLLKKKWVLFSGTPCQVAGLKSYLMKEYDTLLTIEIICHGTPSPSIFDKYIKEIESKYKSKITNINFRNNQQVGKRILLI